MPTNCATSRSCTRRDARREVLPSDHQEDGQAGPPGPVHHEGVMTDRGSARPDMGWAGRPEKGADVRRPRLKRTRESLITAAGDIYLLRPGEDAALMIEQPDEVTRE